MAPSSAAPTREVGVTNSNVAPQLPGWGSLGGVVDDLEKVPALRWPLSVRETYPAMRNDSQIEALFYATTLPIRRYRWAIDPNGAREEAVMKASADFGLPILGADAGPIPRSRGRFSFADHLRLALQALIFGGYFFEQAGEIAGDGLFHLRKLAPRAPHTIEEIEVDADGGLRAIRQMFGRERLRPEPIGVERLVAYIWDQEPGRWHGRSMLRSIYREWLLKDRLIRVDAAKHERNGMGIPTAKATSPDVSAQSLAAAQAIANAWRAGDHASATFPYGVDVELKGVQGNLPDTLASIERHDQAMSKRWLGMLLDLGNTPNGSRALGETHADLIELGRDAIAGWVCDVFSEHVLEDDVDWNFGENEEFCPRLVYERDPGPQSVEPPPMSPEELTVALQKIYLSVGTVITPDEAREILDRAGAGLGPAPDDLAVLEAASPPATAASRQPRAKRTPVRAATDEPEIPVPDRPLRRQPNEPEVQARLDFEAIDTLWESARDALVSAVRDLQSGQIDELRDLIEAADGDLSDLATIQADPVAETVLAESMHEVLEEGARQAIAEADRQGVTIGMPDLDEVEERLTARAAAIDQLLARSISEAAARQAIQRTGQALSAAEVADQTADYLRGLTDAYLVEQLGGALTQAQNSGRRAVIAQGTTTATRIYASELLDASTCEVCMDLDGTEYGSLEEAEKDYPTGGAAECLGGPRCRGTLVAVYDEQPASVE